MDQNVFLRESESGFKWVAKRDIDPSKSTFAFKINLTLRSSKYAIFNQPIYIVSYIGNAQPAGAGKKPGVVELYKSALQKAVRRKKAAEAVEITHRLWELRPFELVRRLMIIMCEDVIITEDYVWLSWLLMALSKGYKLVEWDYQRLISLVDWMCRCSVRDTLRYHDDGMYDCELPEKPTETAVLKAILVRIGYGGMLGDVKMLENFYDLWWKRFERGVEPFSRPVVHIVYHPIPNPVMLEAVDQHCSKLCETIEGKTDYPLDQIKKLIWNHRSSVNYRKFIWVADPDIITVEADESYEKRHPAPGSDFDAIKDLADEYSRLFIQSYGV